MVNIQKHQTQALIVGAGPAGLYSAFALGLLGISSHILDVLPQAGGQCIQLYPDKPIYDIPALTKCNAGELTERLLKQLQPFEPVFHFNQLANELQVVSSACDQRHFEVTTDKGLCIQSQVIVVATGSGAFLPRKIKLDDLENFVGTQVFYFPPTQTQTLEGRHVVIHGDLEQSLQTANQLASLQQARPASVTLIHRRDKFRAEENTLNQTAKLRQTGALQFLAGTLNGLEQSQGELKTLEVKMSADASIAHIPADILFILNGAAPILGPVEDWQLALEHKQLVVDPASFQTSETGIFAVGDAITYPGKRKLIVSAFHEAALASYAIASYLNGGAAIPVQYTSSNTALQARLNPSNT